MPKTAKESPDARFSLREDLLAQLATVGLVGAMRAAEATVDAPRLVRLTGLLATEVLRLRPELVHDRASSHGRAVALITRASWVIPGANCLHRALAGRLWLAWHGEDARVVLGVRKGATLEGHAWLHIDGPRGGRTLFLNAADGYVSVLDDELAPSRRSEESVLLRAVWSRS